MKLLEFLAFSAVLIYYVCVCETNGFSAIKRETPEHVEASAIDTPSSDDGRTRRETELTPETDPLGFLRTHPQFEQMRAMVKEDPQLLSVMLQKILDNNPVLLKVIEENQEEFMRLLKEDSESTLPSSSSSSDAGALGLTPQDKEAIERIKSLGFPEQSVVQAYLRSEKNETMAANLLLQQMDEDN